MCEYSVISVLLVGLIEDIKVYIFLLHYLKKHNVSFKANWLLLI